MWAALGAFLLSIMGSLAARVLVSLGIGTVSYFALNTLATTFITHVTTAYSGIASTTLTILNMSGLSAGVSIICSGIVTKAALMAINKLGSLTLSNGVNLPRW